MTFNRDTEECVVQYGRIGSKAGEFHYDDNNSARDGQYSYPASMFWVKYFEKLSKGYIDRTELKDFGQDKKELSDFAPIKDEDAKPVIEELIAHQRHFVAEHYDLSVPASKTALEASAALIRKMEKACNDRRLSEKTRISRVETYYKELMVTLPRKVLNVSDYIGRINWTDENSPDYIANVLDYERTLYENFKDVYEEEHGTVQTKKSKKDVLNTYGLDASLPDFSDRFLVYDKMGEDAYKTCKVLSVVNKKTTKAFEEGCKEMGIEEQGIHLLWHGSRMENWWSIFKNGMSLNPDAVITGKMFGAGLYFAPLAKKSLGYVDGGYWTGGGSKRHGYLALFDVAMGKPYEPNHALGSYFSKKDLGYGCNSVWAYPAKTSLRNEECIVYDERQCNIRYLVQVETERLRGEIPFDEKFRKKVKVSVESENDTSLTFTLQLPKKEILSAAYDKNMKTFQIDGAYLDYEKDYLAEILMSKYADNEKAFEKAVNEHLIKEQTAKTRRKNASIER
jgi:poly [ADP-ribose] polymerase